jgi:predicted  nucleic acid-binding Zn-ribbon protein
MNSNIDVLKSFIERIKVIGFFRRLFEWRKVRNELIEISAAVSSLSTELQLLQKNQNDLQNDFSDQKKDLDLANKQKTVLEEAQKQYNEVVKEKDNSIADLNKKLTTANTNCKNLEGQVDNFEKRIARLEEKLQATEQNFTKANNELIELKKEEETRQNNHTKAINTFEVWRKQIQDDRNNEIQEKQQMEIDRLKYLKQTWIEHENNIKIRMKALCLKHTIAYADTVPFKGNPDNAIKLANEFIVFDAKSPGSDDLSNFPTYLRDQAEKAKKYAKQDGVKKDIFFVVPSNTLEVLKQTRFALGDYDVFVISIDVLEPLLLCLLKIETYEFVDQLTPEERENICRIIGRFTHLTKRRVQIDSFFAKQFMEMVLKCDSDLPDEIKKEVAAFEKAEKLNPPPDKRNKSIDNKQLLSDVLQLEMEIENKGIALEDLSGDLNKLKLYKGD